MNTEERVRKLAALAQQIKFDDLMFSRREKGFSHYIRDLTDEKYSYKGHGWNIEKGILTIQPNYFLNQNTKDEIHSYLDINLGKNTWYEKIYGEIITLEPEINYGITIKTLGKLGENGAVDPEFFIQDKKGGWNVLSIQRHDDSYALPGGMNESTVKQTCINELLEECFSGNLFAPNTPTALNVDTNTEIDSKQLISDIKKSASLPEKDFAKVMQGLIEESIPSQIIHHFISSLEKFDLDETKREDIATNVRCHLFKTYCVNEYQEFTKFVQQRMEVMDKIINASDPRNTNLAWMVTTPLMTVIREEEFEELSKKCGLSKSAGSDAKKVGFRSLEVFCGDINNTYSDHSAMLLSSLAYAIAKGMIKETPKLLAQLEIIEKNLSSARSALDSKMAKQASSGKERFTELNQSKETLFGHKEKHLPPKKLDEPKSPIGTFNPN